MFGIWKNNIHSIRWAGAGAGGWSGVREKYCWLAGRWKLVLERCEKKTLLGWRLLELPIRVILDSGVFNKLENWVLNTTLYRFGLQV